MRGLRWVAIASLLGPVACANVWGFDNLTAGAQDGGQSDAQGGCNLASNGACKFACAGDASPCGCLSDPVAHTSYCGATGTGVSGAPCSSDRECAPGYGCMQSSTRTCSPWCLPPTSGCPIGACHTNSMLTYNDASYGFCY